MSPEEQRGIEFTTAQLSREESASESMKLWHELFTAAEAEQDRLFQMSEDRRNTTFAQSQAMLQHYLEEMTQHHNHENDYMLNVIKSSNGSARRESAFRQLNEKISEEFTAFLRSEQDAFLEAQSIRTQTLIKLGVCQPIFPFQDESTH